MIIAFRTDASLQIGTGHVMRCLTLADSLKQRGAQSIFICRPHIGHLLDFIKERGHTVFTLSPPDSQHIDWLGSCWESDAAQTRWVLGDQRVDWLVVDHYALDQRWEEVMRPCARRILVIDDLADRPHDCDLLLDQNLGRRAQHYEGLLKPHTKTLIGPAFALLRTEFAQWREYSLQRRVQPKLKNILITMGGVDQVNATGQVLEMLNSCELPSDLQITVVMGSIAPWLAEVQAQAQAMSNPTQVLLSVNNMAQIMSESDLCIGAAGGSALERCCLGLPTLVLILAANQQAGALALQAHGAARLVEDAKGMMKQLIMLFSTDKAEAILSEMTQVAAKLTTGDGAMRVLDSILANHD